MILAIIPARYDSTRFPGKPLAMIEGISMIQRVYQQAKKSGLVNRVIIATDDSRIEEHVRSFGGEVLITSSDHVSGTDRCYEAYKQLNKEYDFIINIQGDEPFIDPMQIDTLAGMLKNGKTELATLIGIVKREEVLTDRSEVKVVINSKMEAMYFSRQAIPYLQGVEREQWKDKHTYYYHIGMYAYRPDILKKITGLPVSALEKAESLEQLRWMENGFTVTCVLSDLESYCIETPEDIEKVLRIIDKK